MSSASSAGHHQSRSAPNRGSGPPGHGGGPAQSQRSGEAVRRRCGRPSRVRGQGEAGQSEELLFLVLDELNKYAPREGASPIKEVLLDVAERGRSLGVILIGAQQTASRWRGGSSPTPRSGWWAGSTRRRRLGGVRIPPGSTTTARHILKPGTMLLAQPEIPGPAGPRVPLPGLGNPGLRGRDRGRRCRRSSRPLRGPLGASQDLSLPRPTIEGDDLVEPAVRLLHTSDWHVGRKIRGRSRAEEHRAVLAEIVGIARDRRVDITLVAGDLFDISSPSPEDESIVYQALLDLAEVGPVLVVGGNHDSAARLEAVKPLLDLGRITVVARPTRPADGGVAVFDSLGLKIACLPFVSQRGIIKAAEIMDLDPDQHAQGYEARLRRIIAGLTEDMGTDTVNVLTATSHCLRGRDRRRRAGSSHLRLRHPPSGLPGQPLVCRARPSPSPAEDSRPPPRSGTAAHRCSSTSGEVSDAKASSLSRPRPGSRRRSSGRLEGGTRLVQVRGTLEQILCPGRGARRVAT